MRREWLAHYEARVAESADALDSKSSELRLMRVRIPPLALCWLDDACGAPYQRGEVVPFRGACVIGGLW